MYEWTTAVVNVIRDLKHFDTSSFDLFFFLRYHTKGLHTRYKADNKSSMTITYKRIEYPQIFQSVAYKALLLIQFTD